MNWAADTAQRAAGRAVIALALIAAVQACAVDRAAKASAQTPVRVIPAGEAPWTALNPARGDASPRAATLWGDRNGPEPTGFLVQFNQGFSSPPHIHNVTYRAVVIEGAIHNDDPQAVPLWMAPGSFWTQPAGEAHITAADAERNVALVEIDAGPYLVRPPGTAFDNGERPINIDASNLVWLPFSQASKSEARIAYLWGDFTGGDWNGSFLSVPAGFAGTIEANGSRLHGVLIAGRLSYPGPPAQVLEPGSYLGIQAPGSVGIEAGAEDSVLYIRTNGSYQLR
ncbi:MAG: DUF4437 domain-containing protein [Pseudomonadota bacterium]